MQKKLSAYGCLLLSALLFFTWEPFNALAGEHDAFAAIGQRMEQHPVIRADFTQSKQIAEVKRPLITHGKLVYSQQHGVLWMIENPYRISYVLGDERIIEINAEGTRKVRELREVAGLAQVGRIFRALLSANTDVLKTQFDATTTVNQKQWQILLIPRQSQLKQFLSRLSLTGNHFVEVIEIKEANGDSTIIHLRNQKSVSEPDASELQLFNGSLKNP